MPVIELEEVQMVELSDEALEAVAGRGGDLSLYSGLNTCSC